MKTVPMVRDSDGKTADVHPAEVENWRKAGWSTLKPQRAPETELEARETGAGWFAVFKGDVKIEGAKAMRAADAEAFTAMSAKERAAHVANEVSDEYWRSW